MTVLIFVGQRIALPLAQRLHALWRRISTRAAPAHSAGASMLPTVPTPMSALLDQAVREDSNLEIDWLWYTSQLHDRAEQQYCQARARAINPHRKH